MRGTIQQRSEGTWTVTLELPRDGGLKRKREVFTVRGTEKEAERAMNRRRVEVEAGIIATGSRMRLSDCLDHWLADAAKSKRACSTVQRYREIVERFLKPTLGDRIVTKLTPLSIEEAVEQWQRTKHAKKKNETLSQRTVHHIYSTLRTALNYAQRKRIITSNPCDNIEPVEKGRPAIKVLDPTAARTLMDRLRDDRLEYPVTLALMTGLRRGELLALKWSDIDAENCRMVVERSLELLDVHRIGFKTTKTGSARVVALPRLAVAALKRHRAQQAEHIMRHRDVYADQELVFPWVDGSPWHPKRFSAEFHRRMKALKVPVSFHGLRHTYATTLLRAGAPMKVISGALGHTTMAVTSDIYSHVQSDLLQAETADRIDAQFAVRGVRNG